MAGAVTSVDGEGTPYLGANIDVPNPVKMVELGIVKPGIFAGYNFRDKTALFGIKAAINLFSSGPI